MLVLDVNFKVHDYHYHDLYQVLTETSHTPKQCAEEICGLADYYLYLVNNLELTDKENVNISLYNLMGEQIDIIIPGTGKGPDVAEQRTYDPVAGHGQEHNRRPGTPFVRSQTVIGIGGYQENRPGPPNPFSRVSW